MKRILTLVAALILCCTSAIAQQRAHSQKVFIRGSDGRMVCGTPFLNSICFRIDPPEGFKRTETDGFGCWMRELFLKEEKTPVRFYNGTIKAWQGGAYAVIDVSIGKRDLVQCADAAIMFRAQYLYGSRQFDVIHFNFTNGFRADYSKWAEGYRIRVNGNKAEWYKGAEPDSSWVAFSQYLDMVYMYAGTASLARELESIPLEDLQIGDVFIQGGSPGHAMIVVDMAEDGKGRKAILVAQGFMPAQDIHIVTNRYDSRNSPWYIFDSTTKVFNFPEWSFTSSQIKRFK